MSINTKSLPATFCWSKMGTEAGENLSDILARKETERVTGNGVFYWGIGTNIAPSLVELLHTSSNPQAIFSPMLSRARLHDVQPENIVRWTEGFGLNGEKYKIPESSLVTSRMPLNRHKRHHWALVCHSHKPLASTPTGQVVNVGHLVNMRSGSPLGASQVTSVVRRLPYVSPINNTREYAVTLVANLIPPYLIRLSEWQEV